MTQTVLITGATSGFGRVMAEKLVQVGYRVIATGRRSERLQQLSQQLGANLFPLTMDMRDEASVTDLFSRLPSEWSEIDVLINNAGLALGVERAPGNSLKDWDEMVQTNVLGMIRLTHVILQKMVLRKKGYIIALGSTAGRYPYPGGNVYGATKAFLEHFMINLKTDLLGTPLRFTTVAPGLCGGSEFSAVRLGSTEKGQAVYEGTTPLQPIDIANTVVWLLSLPEHVNINLIEMMPVCQAPAGLAIDRKPNK